MDDVLAALPGMMNISILAREEVKDETDPS
jgi:hypothetical protein